MLDRYGHHACVVGVGVDVEWYRSVDKPEGQAVTDAEATAWLQAARSHGQHYRLFLKHWEIGKMPPTVRDGLFFIDDSQIFLRMALGAGAADLLASVVGRRFVLVGLGWARRASTPGLHTN